MDKEFNEWMIGLHDFPKHAASREDIAQLIKYIGKRTADQFANINDDSAAKAYARISIVRQDIREIYHRIEKLSERVIDLEQFRESVKES